MFIVHQQGEGGKKITCDEARAKQYAEDAKKNEVENLAFYEVVEKKNGELELKKAKF